MADRNGVEIDYCPKCRGVWLDRGELDKIIDRAATAPAAAPVAPPRAAPSPGVVYQPEPKRFRDEDDEDDRYHPKRKRREGFLGELFDF